MKNIIITGASGGLGKQLAIYYAANGWNVIAALISIDHQTVFDGIANVFCCELDVTSTESIRKAKEKILQNFDVIDAIINNAGIGYRSFVELSEDEKTQQIVDVNWLGVVKMCREFIPIFRKQNFGQFINITSVAGLVNLPLGSFYHSTKHAVESFSECMAYELYEFNISVCTVQFGNVPTNFQKNGIICQETEIESYSKMIKKISKILQNKSSKNHDLVPVIVAKIFNITKNPAKKFRKHTIGFDANFMKYLNCILGNNLFHRLICYKILKKQ